MDKCEKRYIIMYKRIVVGKIEINMLSNTFVLVAKKSYKWSIKNIHQSQKKTHNTEDVYMTDVLDCLCITKDDVVSDVDLQEFLKIEERHSK
jgi:hypothetical protein